MKILTLNTHSLVEKNYEEKLLQFLEVIEKEEPDVFALQEVNQTATAEVYPSVMLKGFHPCKDYKGIVRLDNHAARLSELLREKGLFYHWSWISAKMGYDIYDEGMAIFSKQEIIETDQFFISNLQDYYNWKTRKALGIKTAYKGGSWFYCVHMGWWKDEEEPFRNQWDRIEEVMADKNEYVWIMGDFNSPAEVSNEGYDYIKSFGWKDSYLYAKQKDSGITVSKVIDGWKKGEVNDTGMRIDMIWSKDEENIASSQVICNGIYYPIVSDHYGVMITIENSHS